MLFRGDNGPLQAGRNWQENNPEKNAVEKMAKKI